MICKINWITRCSSPRKWSFLLLNKTELRQEFSLKRRAVASDFRMQAATRAAEIFAQSAEFHKSQHIACYMPLADEFDSRPLIAKLWQAEKKCYLPVISENNTLKFALYTKASKLISNKYKILEPYQSELVLLDQLDMVVVPLLACDEKGNRLGMGAGYYDKTFVLKKKNIILLGLGYELQRIKELPCDAWDVKLNKILTEENLYSIP